MGQKALAYIRVSSRDQVENFSLPTQRSACLQRAQQDGYELIRVFEDAGASARTADRPALIEMLEFCRVHKGVVQRVYVYSVNRLARRSMDHHAIRATLAKFGIRLMSVTEVLDDSPSGRFLEAVLAAASELDNDQRLAQIVRGMKAATLSGRFPHKAPIGMLNGRKSKGEPSLLPDPVKAPLVREAFERCAAGEDPTAVRRDLERRGLVAYRSKKLPRATFYAMLANKVYAGLIETKFAAGRGDWSAIINEEIFYQVQARLHRQRHAEARRYVKLRADFRLRGLVKCGCGRRLTGAFSRSKNGNRYPYYPCRSCHLSYAVAALDDSFLEWLDELTPMRGYLRLAHESIRRAWNREKDRIDEQRKVAERQVKEANAQLEQLHRRALLGEAAFDADVVRRLRGELDERKAAAEAVLVELSSQPLDVDAVLEFVEEVLGHAGRVWLDATPEQRAQLNAVFFPQGVIYDGVAWQTPVSAFEMNDLRGSEGEKVCMVDLRGVEPLTS